LLFKFEHIYSIAVLFNHYYGNTSILNEEAPVSSASYLSVVQAVKNQLYICTKERARNKFVNYSVELLFQME